MNGSRLATRLLVPGHALSNSASEVNTAAVVSRPPAAVKARNEARATRRGTHSHSTPNAISRPTATRSLASSAARAAAMRRPNARSQAQDLMSRMAASASCTRDTRASLASISRPCSCTRNPDSRPVRGTSARMSSRPAQKAGPRVDHSSPTDSRIWYGPDQTICRYGAAS